MDQISQTTIKEIVEAVNIVEVQKIAQKFQFDLGKERVINLIISGCIYNPNCILKFVAFLKELVEKNFFEDFNIKKKFQMIQGKCLAKNKVDFITKNFFLKSYSIEDDMKLCNIFTSFFGHCYNNDLLDSNFPLFTLQLFNSYQLKKITILNYWLIVGEKFTNSIKYKNRKIVQEVQQKIDKIKILEDGFENEIFSNTEMEIIKYFENLPEKKIVDEILDFPNLEGDQKKLDMIFLINLYKVNLKLSVKEENYVKEIQERFKNECYENVLDFRYINESKIEQTFKEFIEKVNENNLELTLREVTWLGGRNFILTQQHSQIDKNHIKFFMLEVFKQQNSENIAEYLGKLENVSSHLSYFTGLISKFCTDFLECCEELLDQKKVSKIQIFKTLKFTGNLYKHDVIKFGAITKIINKLDSQNFRNLIKFLGFEISEKFVKDMKNEFIKKSSTATEILAEVEEKMQKTSLESSPKRIKLEKNLSEKFDSNFNFFGSI
ncbi:hypothetical protein PVAND_015164 [Polypedilum vanderplanki]|uniref:Uncharacterized protein n=1 Tax=Polypedilum vanderplanki TaxID=319348 RepID=A0A9J6BC83_POLVA|nr:hypothetical protein PVAND_015164 [Polypedilum vanderplanki]